MLKFFNCEKLELRLEPWWIKGRERILILNILSNILSSHGKAELILLPILLCLSIIKGLKNRGVLKFWICLSTYYFFLVFDIFCIGFFKDLFSEAHSEFLKAASNLRDNYRFAHTNIESLVNKYDDDGE